jgi:hypothetical protein
LGQPVAPRRRARASEILGKRGLATAAALAAAWRHAAPPAWRAQLDGGRGFGFLLGFALAAAWLRVSPEAPPPRAAAE